MPDAYSYIAKPSDANYTNTNVQGREQYDQSNLTYDDSSTYYDGVNEFSYTSIAKPTSSVYTIVAKPIT